MSINGMNEWKEAHRCRTRRRTLVLWGLVAFVAMGLYQSGYTGPEWEDIQRAAVRSAHPVAREVQRRDGVLGLARLIWMTNSDERLYGEYARLCLEGRADLDYIAQKQYAQDSALEVPTEPVRPYRDVRVEYPPVALLAMVLPGLVTLDPWGYRFLLGLMNLLLLWSSMSLAGRVSRGSAGTETTAFRVLMMVILLGIVTVTRIDLAGVTLMLAAVLLCQGDRALAGGVVTGLGILSKLFPGLWGATFCLVALRHARYRSCLVFALSAALTVTSISVLLWWLAGDGYWDAFLYHARRGIQIESTWASVLLPVHLLGGTRVSLDLAYGSSNLQSFLDPWIGWLWPALFVCLCAPFVVAVVKRRNGAQSTVVLAGFLLAFLLANKVLSPQFLLWVAPLLLVGGTASGRRDSWLFLAACLLSQVLYPRGYDLLKAFHPLMVGVLLARNGLLAWLWWRLARRAWSREVPLAEAGLVRG